jgi:hypothetical protein
MDTEAIDLTRFKSNFEAVDEVVVAEEAEKCSQG